MNFTPLNVAIILAGVVLIYAALRDVDPRDVVRNALKGKATVGTKTPKGSAVAPPSAITPPDAMHTSV